MNKKLVKANALVELNKVNPDMESIEVSLIGHIFEDKTGITGTGNKIEVNYGCDWIDSDEIAFNVVPDDGCGFYVFNVQDLIILFS